MELIRLRPVTVAYSGRNMPKIGDIKVGERIDKRGYNKYVWRVCVDCGDERWSQLNGRTGIHPIRCRSCNAKTGIDKHPKNWNGYSAIKRGRYMVIRVEKCDPYFPMADNDRYVGEHRLVMAKHLGRCLKSSEVVHHINHNKLDNRIENLQLTLNDEHQSITVLESKIKLLEKRISMLEAQVLILEVQSNCNNLITAADSGV